MLRYAGVFWNTGYLTYQQVITAPDRHDAKSDSVGLVANENPSWLAGVPKNAANQTPPPANLVLKPALRFLDPDSQQPVDPAT
jgi:hypothetical protein